MSYSAILAEIKLNLETVTNIGQVHNSVRWTIFEDEFIDRFTTEISGQREVRTWFITRENVRDAYGPGQNILGTQRSLSTRKHLRRHDILIEGFMSFKDNDTEDEFQALIDSILDQLKNVQTFNNTAWSRGQEISIIVDMIEFGVYLCHHCGIAFYVLEESNFTPS